MVLLKITCFQRICQLERFIVFPKNREGFDSSHKLRLFKILIF